MQTKEHLTKPPPQKQQCGVSGTRRLCLSGPELFGAAPLCWPGLCLFDTIMRPNQVLIKLAHINQNRTVRVLARHIQGLV
jgi:hypothetical protein